MSLDIFIKHQLRAFFRIFRAFEQRTDLSISSFYQLGLVKWFLPFWMCELVALTRCCKLVSFFTFIQNRSTAVQYGLSQSTQALLMSSSIQFNHSTVHKSDLTVLPVLSGVEPSQISCAQTPLEGRSLPMTNYRSVQRWLQTIQHSDCHQGSQFDDQKNHRRLPRMSVARRRHDSQHLWPTHS